MLDRKAIWNGFKGHQIAMQTNAFHTVRCFVQAELKPACSARSQSDSGCLQIHVGQRVHTQAYLSRWLRDTYASYVATWDQDAQGFAEKT